MPGQAPEGLTPASAVPVRSPGSAPATSAASSPGLPSLAGHDGGAGLRPGRRRPWTARGRSRSSSAWAASPDLRTTIPQLAGMAKLYAARRRSGPKAGRRPGRVREEGQPGRGRPAGHQPERPRRRPATPGTWSDAGGNSLLQGLAPAARSARSPSSASAPCPPRPGIPGCPRAPRSRCSPCRPRRSRARTAPGTSVSSPASRSRPARPGSTGSCPATRPTVYADRPDQRHRPGLRPRRHACTPWRSQERPAQRRPDRRTGPGRPARPAPGRRLGRAARPGRRRDPRQGRLRDQLQHLRRNRHRRSKIRL